MAIKSRIRLNQIQDEVGDLAVGQGGNSNGYGSEANLQDVLLNLSDMIERRFGADSLDGTSALADKYGNLFNEQADLGGAIVYAFGRQDDLVIRNNGGGAIDIDAAAEVEIDAGGALSMEAAAASDLTITDGGLTISSTATADAQDMVISQIGDFDASILVSSAGTGSDAISLAASAGGVTVVGATASSFTATAGDLTLAASTDSVMISGASSDADAISLQSAAGGIDADAAGQINVDSAADGSTNPSILLNASHATLGMVSSVASAMIAGEAPMYAGSFSTEWSVHDSLDGVTEQPVNWSVSAAYDENDDDNTVILFNNITGISV